MLEAVWAQQRDEWAMCVGQAQRALEQHNQLLKPPVETRRMRPGDGAGKPEASGVWGP